jgi:hypothetical protein
VIVKVLEIGNVAPLAGRDAIAAQLHLDFALKRLAQIENQGFDGRFGRVHTNGG